MGNAESEVFVLNKNLQAILFDCDGVLAETERDGHRVAYNLAFREKGIDADWDSEFYRKLVTISGGKERMRFFFSSNPDKYPQDTFNSELIQELYLCKTEIFKKMCEEGILPARPGISRLIREAYEKGVKMFVCSTSHRESVVSLLIADVGEQSPLWFTDLLCGDIVPRKKPAPDIYNLAKQKYSINQDLCVVVEDSRNGLLAAKGAGMHCLITPSYYTVNEDFSEADAVVSSLGEPGRIKTNVLKPGRLCLTDDYVKLADLTSLL